MPETQPGKNVGRLYVAFDWSVDAERWLERSDAPGWMREGFFREFASEWGGELDDAFQAEVVEGLELPLELRAGRRVDGSLLLVGHLVWHGAQAAWPTVHAGVTAVSTGFTIHRATSAIRSRLHRRANIDAQTAAAGASPPQEIVVVIVIVDFDRNPV